MNLSFSLSEYGIAGLIIDSNCRNAIKFHKSSGYCRRSWTLLPIYARLLLESDSIGGKVMKTGMKSRPGLWLSTSVSIVGLILVVFLSNIVENTLNLSIHPALLTIISVLIAFVPPLIWLTVFYRQDRKCPEPKSFVFKTLILGALVQKAVYTPLMSIIMPDIQSGPRKIISDYIFTIIIVALIQESMKLLSVRYSIYNSREFDEKIDGIIYGSALGLGFAAMSNLDLIINNGGATLTAVSSTVVIESLAHASFTGLSCYFLGIAKYNKFSILRLPAAILIATILNALSRFLIDNFTRDGFKVNFMLGIIPAALVAVVVFGILIIITSRSQGNETGNETLTRRQAVISALPVWALLAVAMITGFAIKNISEKMLTVPVSGNLNITYPSTWTKINGADDLFKASDVISGGGENFVSVKEVETTSLVNLQNAADAPALEDLGAAWAIKTGRNYKYYQPVKTYILQFDGKDAYIMEYIYISSDSSAITASQNPAMGYSRDIILASGDKTYIVTVSTGYNDWVLKKDNFSRIDLSLGSN